ncbi:radical SAM/SPASM family putative metalloenzyme maturase [Maridesulfovibrio sp.]|uniref:radical SAM/SPASM family putative metalloenzyme maturase n=1 Tax=Maridesulfovibrio sp. TaxID=2795000 RepID=UPI002A18B2D9|nr:radical SAM/SPASM family putative metalloenzyme maturase [Maridesulfovibrio sp.]
MVEADPGLSDAGNFPARMQVEVTTRCNMNCSMCVKYAPDSLIREADLEFELFKKLGPGLKHCEMLVLNGIGEPLLHPQLTDMAAFARSHMPEKGRIGFQTNALLLTERSADDLVEAGVDTFCVSVDSLDSESSVCTELHGQCSVDRLARSFGLLRSAADKKGKRIHTGVEFVLMKDTYRQLPSVIEWAAEQGAEFVICSHMLAYAAGLQDQSLFNPNTAAATAVFDRWQAKAREIGMDLHEYFDVLWKRRKPEQRKDYLALGNMMRAEATGDGIWLHLASLLEWDRKIRSDEYADVRQVYEESARIAGKLGLELHLPPLMATDELRCAFVEDGAVFVTSEGDVSPCQFLWHGYTCYLDGNEKVIRPRVFGNLADRELLDIWRSAEYSEFRNDVLAYEYPYCSNCPMVPCDDIVGRDFEFECDCFGVRVPCGHCPWSMGGLKCLL